MIYIIYVYVEVEITRSKDKKPTRRIEEGSSSNTSHMIFIFTSTAVGCSVIKHITYRT